jgi:PAS domain S-box-containing protein
MNTFGISGGLLVLIIGLAVIDYGLDPKVPYAYHAFYLGLAGIVMGGIIIWASSRRSQNPLLTQPYQPISTKSLSPVESIKYRKLYEESPVMQRTVNTDGIVLECNQKYAKTIGYPKNEIIGKSIFDFIAEQSIKEMSNTFESWNETGHAENREIWFKRKDGSTFPALLSANNIYDEKGKLIGSNSAIRDISDVYEARRVLVEHEKQRIQLEELQKMNLLKEEFYLSLSQECKLPLEPIKRYCESLNDPVAGNLNKEQLQAVNEIYDNTIRLERILDDISDVQKLVARKMTFNKEAFSINEFMKSVVEIASPMMKEKKIEFVHATKEKSTLKSDTNRLKQVFDNLIQNAVDFVPQKGGKIEIGARKEDDSITFYVKDNGMGISEKRKDSVFKKYYQVNLSLKRRYGGSGFGLVICRLIVENLQGKIWFESKEGEGTTFYFTIPLSK